MNGIGPKLPLMRDNRFGNYSLIVTFKEQIKQNFKNLVLTSPGERVMLPDFGVGMRRFLFQPEVGLESDIKKRLYSQTAKYMPFINIQKIEFNQVRGSRNNPNMLSVRIQFNVPSINLNSVLELGN
tara:strand:+ start:148 stop:525 length:378 start_codon:yes stop_codon:yes gene_type:complete